MGTKVVLGYSRLLTTRMFPISKEEWYTHIVNESDGKFKQKAAVDLQTYCTYVIWSWVNYQMIGVYIISIKWFSACT